MNHLKEAVIFVCVSDNIGLIQYVTQQSRSAGEKNGHHRATHFVIAVSTDDQKFQRTMMQ